ncbi:hypothetical protein FKP32DRAFT_1543961, partial [Trametes sanguinea]
DSTTKDAPFTPAITSGDLFLDHLSENTEGVDLLQAIRGRFDEDEFFAKILEAPKNYKNFRVEDGLVFVRDRGQERLCVPRVIINGRSAHEMVISHAHSLLAHLGSYKTLGFLRDHLWWKT